MANPFKAYDVRGIYGTDINEDLAYKIGRAFVQYLEANTIVLGRDMRTSSPSLSQRLIQGIIDAGANVIDIGLSSTDMLYFASIDLGTDGAIQVTASHNSKEYNGFKFCRKSAIPIGIESGLADIEKIVREENFKPCEQRGSIEQKNIKNDFIKFMHSFVNPKDLKPLSVVVDTGNGMGGYIMPDLLKDSPVKVTPMFFELDGSFPNHDANPLEEKNRKDLISKVIEMKADIGVGLDGDTDRAFFIDGNGQFCSGDFILGLIAKDVLKKHKGSTIIYDVRCSRYVKDTVEKLGGIAKMWKVGHAFAKIYMRETGAEFGGEVSGHYYFKYKDAYFDSGNLTVLVLLKVLSDDNVTLAKALEETAGYHISGEINSIVNDPDEIMLKIRNYYTERAECILDIDGVSIISKEWWANIRKSNTEPLLRLNCEAFSEGEMERLRDQLLYLIRN